MVKRTIKSPSIGSKCLDEALRYAVELEWVTFPADNKKSYLSARYSDGRKWGMTKDPAQIRKNYRKHPDAGIGIPTGAVNDIFVVETDTKKGGHKFDGKISLKELEAQHSAFPVTLMAMSPSGSVHYYFKHPGGGAYIKNTTSDLGPGIDVRGDGGMVVAPPSVRSDGVYKWLNWGTPIADAPQWLIDLVKRKPREPRPAGSPLGAVIEFGLLKRALSKIPMPADMTWHTWKTRYMMAFWRGCDGSAEGLEAFAEWTEKWPGHTEERPYDLAYVAAAWDAIESCPPDEINGETILWEADQNPEALGWRRQYEEEKTHAVWETFHKQRRAQQIGENKIIGDAVPEPNLPTIMTISQMIEQLVFVRHKSSVIHRTTKRVSGKDDAIGVYAASRHTPKGEKKAVIHLPIWKIQPNRKEVDTVVWAPGEPEFCDVPGGLGGHRQGYNIWRGFDPVVAPADWRERAKLFIEHVTYSVPVEGERKRFLQWLAHIAQHPGDLPHTAYLMITETQGIGRNLLASMLVRVFRGYVAAGLSLDELITEKFNGRLSQKVLAGVDELQEGPSNQRYERERKLRSSITVGERMINPKYGVQTIEKNCMRNLFFSNFLNALPFNNKDRRYENIANPTVPMPPEYYTRLYNVTKDPLFTPSVWEMLRTWDLAGFNLGQPAVMNEIKLEAIASMTSALEYEVIDFKAGCKTELVSRRDIEEAVTSPDSKADKVTSYQLNCAITAAGMVSPGRRIPGKPSEWHVGNVRWHSIVIVNLAKWSRERVKTATPEELFKAMGRDKDGLLPPKKQLETPIPATANPPRQRRNFKKAADRSRKIGGG